MSSTGSSPRSSRAVKSGSNSATIALLVLVVAAIGFIGYFAFIKTGREVVPNKAGSLPLPSPSVKSAPPAPPS